MKDQTSELSDISEQILNVLRNHPTPESLKNKHFLNKLEVILLIKKPPTHAFICDSKVSVQIEFKTESAKPVEQYDLNPYNKIMTHYYQVSHEHNKHIYSLNCTDKTLLEKYNIKKESVSQNYYNQEQMVDQNHGGMFPGQSNSVIMLQKIQKDYEPHAYEPLFYFPRNSFQFFIKNRNNLTISQPLQKIRIYDWVLKAVNISKSGSYALVIEVHKLKFLNEKIWVDGNQTQKGKSSSTFQLRNVGSILYESNLQKILQKMRLKDVRSMFDKQLQENEDQISMCYHLRNAQTTYKLPKIAQFVSLDKQGEVLKFNKKIPVHYIPVGQLEGMCTFAQPTNLNKHQKQEQLRQLNSFSMKGLYDILNKELIQKINKKKQVNALRRNQREKIGNEGFGKMISDRLQNSYLLIHQKNKQADVPTFQTSEQEDNSLWSDSNHQNKEELQKKDEMDEQKQKDILQEYSKLLNNQSSQQHSSSSQEENEYFKRYREETRKQLTK